MAVSSAQILKLLKATFEDSEVEIIDLVGDSNHYEVRIKSEKFNGLSRVAQHKLVMDSLGDIVGKELHALSIKTYSK